MIKGLHHDQRHDTREEDRARQDNESDLARSVARALSHVILSEAKDLELRISKSFATFSAQDDGGFRVTPRFPAVFPESRSSM